MEIRGGSGGLSIDVRSENLEKISNLSDLLHEVATEIASRLSQLVLTMAKERSPVDTGALQESWSLEGAGQNYVVKTGLPYAYVLEFGLYKGVGPKTVAYQDGIFSTQAIGGILRPLAEHLAESKLIDAIIENVFQEKGIVLGSKG